MKTKFEQNWDEILAKVIRFGKNQYLASPNASYLLQLCTIELHRGDAPPKIEPKMARRRGSDPVVDDSSRGCKNSPSCAVGASLIDSLSHPSNQLTKFLLSSCFALWPKLFRPALNLHNTPRKSEHCRIYLIAVN